MEAADSVVCNERDTVSGKITLVLTPNIHTIEEVCAFFNVTKEKSCKAVVYQRNSDDSYIVVFIRGDLEVNEKKLTNHLGIDFHSANITDDCELAEGYIGPYLLNGNYTVLYDKSLENSNNLICGGNVEEHHYTGLDMQRDIGNVAYHDFAKNQDGWICPCCGKKSIFISRGVEVGNIFQLGTKYTKSMGITYIDKEGGTQYPIMGCYNFILHKIPFNNFMFSSFLIKSIHKKCTWENYLIWNVGK